MTLFRPALLLHGVLAAAAFAMTLVWAAGWEGAAQAVSAQEPVGASKALAHAQAVYRTMRYAEAEDALRCAGFGDLVPARAPRPPLGKDDEVVPHPAVKYAAEVDLPRLRTGASLCAHLQQAAVHQWYFDRFMH